MSAAIDQFLAALRSHPVIVEATASDHALADHLGAFEECLAAISRADDPNMIAVSDEIAEIVRGGVSKQTMLSIARVLKGLQSCRH